MNYFVFNKSLDYQRGRMEQCEYRDGCLRLIEGAGKGVFISRLLDGREKDLIWHRFTMESQSPSDACIRLTLYASESRSILFHEKDMDLKELLSSEEFSVSEVLDAVKPYEIQREVRPRDFLLHNIKGRYLWLVIELLGQEGESPKIKGLRISFPKQTWLDYLPQIYQKDPAKADFLGRYLGIFQTIYEDTEEKIRKSHELLDVKGTEKEFLGWLAEWLDADSIYLWKEEKLRVLLSHSIELYRMRGTRQGLLSLLTLYTGEEPYMIEPFQAEDLDERGYRREEFSRLYGGDPYRFYILIPEHTVPSSAEYEALMKLVYDMAPACMEGVLIPLKPYLVLGNYTYLGINSRLGRYRALKLDGLSLLSFTAVGGRQGEEQ